MNPLDHPLDLEAHDDGHNWTVLQPVHYDTAAGERITVPAGYVTDFASVPRALWWLLPPTGRYQYAALIHDWLYDQHHQGCCTRTRAAADALLLEVMIASGVPRWQRLAIYAGVRLGGHSYWAG